jgi:hypothetical protein
MIVEVGDFVQVLETRTSERGTDRMEYIVEDKRTGARGAVPWNTSLPVGTRELCQCVRQYCRCVYVDYEKGVELSRRGAGH